MQYRVKVPRKGEYCMIVGDAVSEYLSSVQRKRDPRTAAGYRQRLGVFASWCEAEGVSLERFSKKGAYRIIEQAWSGALVYDRARLCHLYQDVFQVVPG